MADSFFADLDQQKSEPSAGGSFFGDLAPKPEKPTPATASASDPTLAPRASDFVPSWRSPLTAGAGAVTGAAQFVKGGINTILHPYEAAKGMYGTAKTAYGEAKSGQYLPAIATAAGVAGFDEPRMASQWQAGNGAAAVGEATPMAVMTALGAERAAGRGAPDLAPVKEGAARMLRTEGGTGEVRPVVTGAARAGTAIHGLMHGNPWEAMISERVPDFLENHVPRNEPAGPGAVTTGPNPPAKLPVVSDQPFALHQEEAPRSEPVQQGLNFPKIEEPAPAPTGKALMDQFGKQVQEGAGWKPLNQQLPLRNQVSYTTDSNGIRWAKTPDSPAPVSIPMRMTDPGEMEAYARDKLGLQKTFSPGTATPAQRTWRNPAELNYPEIGAGKMVRGEPGGSAPSYLPEIVNEGVGRQYGAGPLETDKPLNAQFGANPDSPPSRQVELETKYPDKAIRQMVHANGEDMVDAVGGDHELLKAVHDLKNPDVRQAMINSGEDMGQKMINNRKASGDVSRQEAFAKLLKKGYTPREIVELAQRPLAGAGEAESKPGPQKWQPLSPAQTGTK